jgi:hypothetical protein
MRFVLAAEAGSRDDDTVVRMIEADVLTKDSDEKRAVDGISALEMVSEWHRWTRERRTV